MKTPKKVRQEDIKELYKNLVLKIERGVNEQYNSILRNRNLFPFDLVSFTNLFTILNFRELFMLVVGYNFLENTLGEREGNCISVGFYRSGAVLKILSSLMNKNDEELIFYYKMLPIKLIEPKIKSIEADAINIYDDSLKTGSTLLSFINLMRRREPEKEFDFNAFVMFKYENYKQGFMDKLQNVMFSQPLISVIEENHRLKLMSHWDIDANFIKERERIFKEHLGNFDQKDYVERKIKNIESAKDELPYFPIIFTNPTFISLICWKLATKIFDFKDKNRENKVKNSKRVVLLSTSFEGDILTIITSFFLKKKFYEKDKRNKSESQRGQEKKEQKNQQEKQNAQKNQETQENQKNYQESQEEEKYEKKHDDIKIFINTFPADINKENIENTSIFLIDYKCSSEYRIDWVIKNAISKISKKHNISGINRDKVSVISKKEENKFIDNIIILESISINFGGKDENSKES